MVDIQRQRTRPKAPAMGASFDLDAVIQARVQELQEAVETLAQEIDEVRASIPKTDKAPPYDDREIWRRLVNLEDSFRTLQLVVLDMTGEFPVHRVVKVTAEQNDYLECQWYNLRLDRADGTIHVAKPPSLRGETGHYTAGDVAVVVQASTGVVDMTGKLLAWMDNSGGGGGEGGGIQIIEVPTKADLPPGAQYNFWFGVTTDLRRLYFNMYLSWICITHYEESPDQEEPPQ